MLTIDMALALWQDAEAAALASFSPSMSMEKNLSSTSCRSKTAEALITDVPRARPDSPLDNTREWRYLARN
jgi:hypothetical protein